MGPISRSGVKTAAWPCVAFPPAWEDGIHAPAPMRQALGGFCAGDVRRAQGIARQAQSSEPLARPATLQEAVFWKLPPPRAIAPFSCQFRAVASTAQGEAECQLT